MSKQQPTDKQAVTTREYMLWRARPLEAYSMRHSKVLPQLADREFALRATLNRQVFQNHAMNFLRPPSRSDSRLHRAGRASFQQRFHVPNHWIARGDVVVQPQGDEPSALMSIHPSFPNTTGDGAYQPRAEVLYELAYTRFTMRESGQPTDRCGVVLLNPNVQWTERGFGDDELVHVYDVTDLLDAPGDNDSASIAERVAEEAVQVLAYLNQPDPASACTPAVCATQWNVDARGEINTDPASALQVSKRLGISSLRA